MAKTRKKASLRHTFSQRLSYLIDRYFLLLISAILFIALILRLMALLSLKKTIYFDSILLDEKVYHTYATKIANGTYQSSSVYEFAPLPAYIMAFIYKIFSPDIFYIRIMNIILGVLTCYLIYLIGKWLADRRTGFFACLIASIYKPFILYSIVPLKTALSVFLFALTTYFLVRILNKDSLISVMLLGMTAGLMLNVRPNVIVIIPIILFILLMNQYKIRPALKSLAAIFVLYVAGFLISILPFVARNYRVSGKLAVTASQAGFNLYLANNLNNQIPYYRPVPFASPSPFEQGVHFIIEASRRTNKKLSPQEASSYWTGEVIRMALENPMPFLWKMWQKTLVFFNRSELDDHYHIGFLCNFIEFFRLPFVSFWLILPFGMAGMAVDLFRSKKSLALSVLFVSYALTLVVYFTNTRYRLPMLVILIPFAVIGIDDIISSIRSGRLNKLAIYSLSITLAFFVIEFLPIHGTEDMTAYYNMHALILDSKGFKDEAIRYWEESSQMKKSFSSFANLSLAKKYYEMNDVQKAVYYLNQISNDSFAAAPKYKLAGDMILNQGQVENAISAYERSLAINSGQKDLRLKLAKLYEKIDKKKASEEYAKYRYLSTFEFFL